MTKLQPSEFIPGVAPPLESCPKCGKSLKAFRHRKSSAGSYYPFMCMSCWGEISYSEKRAKYELRTQSKRVDRFSIGG